MKRYIKSSTYSSDPTFKGKWSEREKQLWQDTDWRARNYEDLIVEDDTISGEAVFYGLPGGTQYKPITFVKHIWANPIYSPQYRPVEDPALKRFIEKNHLVGPMFDGNVRNGYDILNRYETSELYERMSR